MDLNKLLCKMLGHKPVVIEKYFNFGSFTRSRCTRCGNETYHKILDKSKREMKELPSRITG